MATIVRLLLLFSGLCSMSSCLSSHHYFLVKTPKTWSEARKHCREKGYDLATIDDMEEMENALKVVDKKYDDAVWIGLKKGTRYQYRWSLADKDFYKEGERNYLQKGSTQINNCATYKEGKFYPITCAHNRYSICFDGTKQGREQYVRTTRTMDWMAAQEYCRRHHTDLASVRNEEEDRVIGEIAAGQQVWIGLYRDPWEWSDRTYSSFRYWKEGKHVYVDTYTTCAAMLLSESGRWDERSCGQAHPFLCNSLSAQVIKVRMSSEDPALDLNDSAMVDNILKQIKQRLNDPRAVLKLRWRKHPDGRVFVKELKRESENQSYL